MTTRTWRHINGKLVEVTGESVERPSGPYVVGDLPAYMSPLGTGMIEGRSARREDMKRGGVREVDPSERGELAPKTPQKLAEERAYLKARESESYRMDPNTFERLAKR